MSIEQILLERFGPLLSVSQLAIVLNRSSEGLRLSLRTPSSWAEEINSTRIKIGRRVYFRTTEIATILNGSKNLAAKK